jgi:hypothetical protein
MKQLLFPVSLVVVVTVMFSAGCTGQSNRSDANFHAMTQAFNLEHLIFRGQELWIKSHDNDDRWSNYDLYQSLIANVNGNHHNDFIKFASMGMAVSTSQALARGSLTNGGFESCNGVKATCTRYEEVLEGWTIISKEGCTNGSYGLVNSSTGALSGNYSLRIYDRSTENFWGVRSERLAAQGGQSWTASVDSRAPFHFPTYPRSACNV